MVPSLQFFLLILPSVDYSKVSKIFMDAVIPVESEQ